MVNTYVRAGAVLGLCAVSFYFGHVTTSAKYEERLKGISLAVAEAYEQQVSKHNVEVEAERKRATAAALKRNTQHQAAQEVGHEITKNLDTSCEWRGDHRLRVERLYGSYGYSPSGSTGVSNTLSSSTINSNAERGVGSSGIHLGGGLQGLAR